MWFIETVTGVYRDGHLVIIETVTWCLSRELWALVAAALLPQLVNPLNVELNPICHLLALLGAHFLHVSRIRVKSLTLRLLMSYICI